MASNINSLRDLEKREYKYEIPAKIFKAVISASDNEFQDNETEYHKYGIERIEIKDLDTEISNNLKKETNLSDSEKVTLFNSANILPQVRDILQIQDITIDKFPPIILNQCKLPRTVFKKVELKNSSVFILICDSIIDSLKITDSIFGSINTTNESNIGYINIDNSIGDNISLVNLKCKSLAIRHSSKFKDLDLNSSEFQSLRIDTSSKLNSIKIQGTSIKYGLSIYDSEVNSLALENNSEIGNCQFKNSTISSNIRFHDTSIGSLSIFDNSFLQRLDIRSINLSKLSIINSTIEQGISISKKSACGTIRINERSKLGDIKITHSKTDSIDIKNCELKDFKISGSDTADITYEKNKGFGKVAIYKSKTNDISIIESKTKKVSLSRLNVGKIELYKLVSNLIISRSIIKEVNVKDSYIIEIIIGRRCELTLSVTTCSINYLNLSNESVGNSFFISFHNVSVYACLIEGLDNLGRLYFRKVKPLKPEWEIQSFVDGDQKKFIKKSLMDLKENKGLTKTTFRISYSSMGVTEFIDCELADFGWFEFNNSRINEIFISGGSLPEDNVVIHEIDHYSEQWFDQMVSFYSQMVSVFQTQGHIYQSIDYKSKAAHYKHQLLIHSEQIEKKWQNRIIKLAPYCQKPINLWYAKYPNFVDRVPFFFNKLSSNYGASWGKALLFLIVWSAILYLLALLSTGNLFQFEMQYDSSFFGFYFDFLNPLRPFDFYDRININANSITRFIDLFSRIVIGYGIYQLLVAFRRYGNK